VSAGADISLEETDSWESRLVSFLYCFPLGSPYKIEPIEFRKVSSSKTRNQGVGKSKKQTGGGHVGL
jgi:hypothetical protein